MKKKEIRAKSRRPPPERRPLELCRSLAGAVPPSPPIGKPCTARACFGLTPFSRFELVQAHRSYCDNASVSSKTNSSNTVFKLWHYPGGIADWEDGGCPFDGEGVQRKEYFAARPSAQPFNQQLIQPVRCVQWDPMAGAINLLVAPRTFNVATRYLHAFTIEVMIVG